jgi:ABC-2 type transport system permease protein
MTPAGMLARTGPWMRRLFVMTRKELLQLSRDVPLLLFLVYSFTVSVYISSAGVTMQLRQAALLVHDADHSRSSRDLIHRFQPPYFALHGEVNDPAEAVRQLDHGRAMALLDIPPRFQEVLREGAQPAVQLLVDTSNAAQGLSAAGYAARIVGQFAADAAAPVSTAGQRLRPLLESEHRVWFNPDQNEAWFQSVTHLLRMITIFSILLPAAALVREKERGTVEQLLVSPLTPFQIMFSKVVAMTAVILTATAVAVFAVMQPAFHVPMRGSAVLFFLLTALFIVTSAGFGLVISTLTRNQAQVGMITLLMVAPMMLLSGISAPFESMPPWVQSLMSVSPLRYYIDVTVGILLKGVGMDLLWKPALAMVGLGAAVFSAGIWRFRAQFD